MIEQAYQHRSSNLLTPREYQSGDTIVQINAREFLPFKESNKPQEALVLFLGWGPNERAPSYDELAHSLADSFGRKVLLVNTRAKNMVDDSLYYEATATHQFLEEMNVTDAVLAGYSQGGVKAANLAVVAQESSSIKPEALILLAPVGIETQTPASLLATFALDTIGQTIPRIATERVIAKSKGERGRVGKVGQSLRSAIDVVSGITGDVVRNNTKYLQRLIHEIKEMVGKNPRLQELKIPVILIQGKHDKLAGPKGDLAQEQMADQDKKGLVEKALKSLFPNSPYVNRVMARRSSNHAFVFLRSPQIAKVVNYLLERKNRAK